MKNSIQLLLILFLSTNLVFCSKDKNAQPFTELNFDNLEDANAAILDLNIDCETEECPEGVGGLASVTTTYELNYFGRSVPSYSLGACSQTLIAPDRVLTNRHCLPTYIQSEGSTCRELTLIFPARDGKKLLRVGCSKVLAISPGFGIDWSERIRKKTVTDWAVLQLNAPVDRSPVTMDTQGVPNDSQLTAYPVYYYHMENSGDTRKIYGTLKKLDCQSKTNHVISGIYNEAHSPVLSLNCEQEVIQGNSGSSFLNSNNSIVGVLQEFSELHEVGFFGKTVSIYRAVIGGSNLHCIPLLNPSMTKSCEFNPDASNHSGFGLSVDNGLLVSENESVKFAEHLELEERVKWMLNESIDPLVALFKDSELYGEVSALTYNSVKRWAHEMENPVSVQCVYPQDDQKSSLEISIPYYRRDIRDLNIDPKEATYHWPLKLDFYEIVLNPSLTEKGYDVEVPLPIQDQLDEMNSVIETMESEIKECVFASYSYKCSNFFKAVEKYEKLLDGSVSPKSYFLNFVETRDEDSLVKFPTFLPLCEDEGTGSLGEG